MPVVVLSFTTRLFLSLLLFFLHLRTHMLMQIFSMSIPLQSVSLIIAGTSVTAGLSRTVVYAAYFDIENNIYDWIFFCSCVRCRRFLRSRRLVELALIIDVVLEWVVRFIAFARVTGGIRGRSRCWISLALI